MIKRISVKLIAVLLILVVINGCGGNQAEPVQVTVFAMDTVIVLSVFGERAQQAVQQAEEELHRLEQLFSVTLPESDIARINAAYGETVCVSIETVEILAEAVQIWQDTQGSFSPALYTLSRAWGFTTGENRVPQEHELVALLESINVADIQLVDNTVTLPEGMELDLGAIAKGYAGSRLVEILASQQIESAILSLGGDVVAVGERPDGLPWRVAIRNPLGDGFLGVVEVRDRAVSTSGSSERWFVADDGGLYHHILDPCTGRPVENGLVSVTVVAEHSARVDALATALFVMGLEKGAAFAAQATDVEVIFVVENGQIYATQGLEGVFLPENYELVSWI